MLAYATRTAVTLWRCPSGQVAKTLPRRPGGGDLVCVAFSPDGRWLASYLEGEFHLLDVSGIRAEPGSGPDPGREAQ